MELRQIRYLLAICEHGSFSRAAEVCGVTQPALTKAIKALEGEVGGALFHREGRRLVLSELGQMVSPHLQRLAGEQDAVLTVAKNYRLLKQAPLRVGILPTIGPARIGLFLATFRDHNPGIELAISEGSTETLASATPLFAATRRTLFRQSLAPFISPAAKWARERRRFPSAMSRANPTCSP